MTDSLRSPVRQHTTNNTTSYRYSYVHDMCTKANVFSLYLPTIQGGDYNKMKSHAVILICLCAGKHSSAFVASSNTAARRTANSEGQPLIISRPFRRSRSALQISNREDVSERKSNKEHVSGVPAYPPSIVLSGRQSAQTLAYRACLLAVTAAYGIQLLLPVLQDAGLSKSSTIGVEPTSLLHFISVASVTTACLLAPKRKPLRGRNKRSSNNGNNNNNKLLVDGKVLAASVATAISGEPLVGVSSLFIREIFYFGLAYKVEAALGLVASLAVLFFSQNNTAMVGTTTATMSQVAEPASWLALAVLTFGKVFEPLEEDWFKSESEFLAVGVHEDSTDIYQSSKSSNNDSGAPGRRLMDQEEVRAMTKIIDNVAEDAKYRSGIATLRSSAHRVKSKIRNNQTPNPPNKAGEISETTDLPAALYKEDVFEYDTSKYNLRQLITNVLQNCDPTVVGTFQETKELEDFILPMETLHRKVNGGHCESAQTYMSDAVATDAGFLQAFDMMVEEIVLPRLKDRLILAGTAKEDVPLSFYIQRPPTLRMQPGPGRAGMYSAS